MNVTFHSGRWILASSFFVAGAVQLFVANTLFADILDLVNQRLPVDHRLSQIGANTRAFEILKLYKSFYPQGTLHAKSSGLGIGGFLCFGIAVLILIVR
jgi:hypothetical protein